MASVSLQEVLTMLEGSSMDNKEDVQKKWRWNECLMCEKIFKVRDWGHDDASKTRWCNQCRSKVAKIDQNSFAPDW